MKQKEMKTQRNKHLRDYIKDPAHQEDGSSLRSRERGKLI